MSWNLEMLPGGWVSFGDKLDDLSFGTASVRIRWSPQTARELLEFLWLHRDEIVKYSEPVRSTEER